MSTPLFIVGSAVAVAFLLLVAVVLLAGRRKLSAAMQKKFFLQWQALEKVGDPARRVLEGDSILDAALRAAGYEGSLGEKLKKAGPRFSNLNAVWAAHKLRNRIAHEPGLQVEQQECGRAVMALRRAFEDLC